MKTTTRKKKKPAARKRVPSSPAVLAVTKIVLNYWPHVLHVEVNGEEQPHRRVPIPSDLLVTKTAAAWREKGAEVEVRKFTEAGEPAEFQPVNP